jgi:hypothetical protein
MVMLFIVVSLYAVWLDAWLEAKKMLEMLKDNVPAVYM